MELVPSFVYFMRSSLNEDFYPFKFKPVNYKRYKWTDEKENWQLAYYDDVLYPYTPALLSHEIPLRANWEKL